MPNSGMRLNNLEEGTGDYITETFHTLPRLELSDQVLARIRAMRHEFNKTAISSTREANAVLIHPKLWNLVASRRDAMKQYSIVFDPATKRTEVTIMGMTVIECPYMAADFLSVVRVPSLPES